MNSVELELVEHIIDTINECFDDCTTDFEDLHFHAFNEDYYIVYYSAAREWIKKGDYLG